MDDLTLVHAILAGPGAEFRLRFTARELRDLYDALEFEGYGTSREDLRELLRERVMEAITGG